MFNKTTWENSPETNTWNAMEAESDIRKIDRFRVFINSSNRKSLSDDKILTSCLGFRHCHDELMDAAREMNEILTNQNNSVGFHINHIQGERAVYSLFKYDMISYDHYGTYPTREEAEDVANRLNEEHSKDELWIKASKGMGLAETPRYAEVTDQFADSGKYFVIAFNPEDTFSCRKSHDFPNFVADFDTLEEAEEEAKKYDEYSIEENPSEEWWMVVNNTTGKSAYKIMFPTEHRALAFLYKVAQPKKFRALLEAYNERGETDD